MKFFLSLSWTKVCVNPKRKSPSQSNLSPNWEREDSNFPDQKLLQVGGGRVCLGGTAPRPLHSPTHQTKFRDKCHLTSTKKKLNYPVIASEPIFPSFDRPFQGSFIHTNTKLTKSRRSIGQVPKVTRHVTLHLFNCSENPTVPTYEYLRTFHSRSCTSLYRSLS